MQRESQAAAETIHPHTMIVSPHENRTAAEAPLAIGFPGDPRIIAPNALDTPVYMTETPERQTPPTNYTVVTEQSPPTDAELEPADAELVEEPPPEPEEPPPEGEPIAFNALTPDVEPTKVWDGQPAVAAPTRTSWMEPRPEDEGAGD